MQLQGKGIRPHAQRAGAQTTAAPVAAPSIAGPAQHRPSRANAAPSKPSSSPAAVRRSTRVHVAAPERVIKEEGTYTSLDESTKKLGKPRVVVLGSGWGAMGFIKSLPKDISEKYEVIVVSPRNYFLYTPLLPAVATGTMEERSIVEPVRNLLQGKGEYYEALVKDIDPVKKELVACFPADAGFPEACFKLSYDICIISVGSVNNTFGIKGVQEHCSFFKSIEDANGLRCRVSECFERAALPDTPEEERKRLLSFVIVGGGPTGVEVAAELYDMVHEDLRKVYPNLIKDVEIRIIELMDHVLSTYDRAISIYTAEQFKRAGVKLVLNSRVASVGDSVVNVVDKGGQTTEIRFGACVWATGVAMNPLVKQLQAKLPGQNHFRSVLTDERLCVLGSNGSMYAIGDAATIYLPKAIERAEELFKEADTDEDDRLNLDELRTILGKASKEFHHLREHASFLDSKAGMSRWGGMVQKALNKSAEAENGPLATLGDDVSLTREEFKGLLGQIDNGLRALPATAQVAKQQGDYLAELFANNDITGTTATTVIKPSQEVFMYRHKGSAAYVGSDRAVFDVPKLGPLTGLGAGVLWKSFETYSQFSFRNQCLVAFDWVRTKLFGRDISRV